MNELEKERVERRMQEELHREKMRRRTHKIIRTLLAWLLVVVLVVAVTVIITLLVLTAGGKSLRKNVQSNRPNLQVITESTQGSEQLTEVEWQEGWIRHNGAVYQYNEDIMTFMVLGVDKKGAVKENTKYARGGQSDGIFLVILNPDEKDIKVLGINRDTMTTIKLYGREVNGVTPEITAQITTQYGFGDSKELSCERTRDAVSALLYDLPIHGYASIRESAIPALNDAVGGVELAVLEDMTDVDPDWTQGAIITLNGEDAHRYITNRDCDEFESARGRLARQKQYLQAFVKKAITEVKKDITLPVTLYQELSKYMVTDVSLDEVAYLANELKDYHFGENGVYTLEGTTVMGEKFEEFYPDKEALKNTMIELFYEEVVLEEGN